MKKIILILFAVTLILPGCKKDTPVSGVTLDKTAIELTEGDTLILVATVFPDDASDKSVTWNSSNPSVATVDQAGKVTTVAPGTANITVTTEDGGRDASCTVTVLAKHTKVQLWDGGPYWATTNIGADKPEDYGDYFMWGAAEKAYTGLSETTFTFGGKPLSYVNSTWDSSKGFDWENCNFTDGVYSRGNKAVFIKYVPEDIASIYGKDGFYDERIVLDADDDAAARIWEEDWRMPTVYEFIDLANNCYWEWTDNYKGTTTVAGCIVYRVKTSDDKGKYNDAGGYTPSEDIHIFLPAAGLCRETSIYNVGSAGGYWSSTLNFYEADCAFSLDFESNEIYSTVSDDRRIGFAVRPVMDAD